MYSVQESIGRQQRPGRKKRRGMLENVGSEGRQRQIREDRSMAGGERWTEDRQAGKKAKEGRNGQGRHERTGK